MEPAGSGRARSIGGGIAALVVGLALVASGLVAAGVLPPAEAVVLPTPTASPEPTSTPTPTPVATPGLAPTPAPTPTPEPTPTPRTAVASRVAVSRIGIDLPVIEENDGFPLCGVALYTRLMAWPGRGRATYISAHARRGMFGPIYDRVIRDGDPQSLIGLRVYVWTTDGLRFEYRIDEVRTGQTSLRDALAATGEQLWLQTSEGPRGTVGVTQVIAPFVRVTPDPDEATPSPRPIVCR